MRRAAANGPRDGARDRDAGTPSSASSGGAGLAGVLGAVGRVCAAARDIGEAELLRAETGLSVAAAGRSGAADLKGTGTVLGGAEGAGAVAVAPVASVGLAMRSGMSEAGPMGGLGSLSGWAGAGAASGRHGLARGAGWMGPWKGASKSWLGEEGLTHA